MLYLACHQAQGSSTMIMPLKDTNKVYIFLVTHTLYLDFPQIIAYIEPTQTTGLPDQYVLCSLVE
jgi:hypothetical protein